MIEPDLPDNEDERLQALHALSVLDTPPEVRFDRLTRLVKSQFHVPIALVSLIDSNRQWFKSRQGLEPSETPRNISFCGHAILHEEIMHVQNALEDPRFFDNPLVTGDLSIRFYAGAPLHAPGGSRIGTLCVIDNKPRDMTEDERLLLRDIADIVEQELALAHQLEETRSTALLLNSIIEHLPAMLILKRASDLRVQIFNKAGEKMLGYSREDVIGKSVLDALPQEQADNASRSDWKVLNETGFEDIPEEVMNTQDGHQVILHTIKVAIRDEQGKPRYLLGISEDITQRKQLEKLKSEFISTVSHELRTPLTSIRGSIGLLAGKFSDSLPEDARKLLEISLRNSDRLTHLINDLLDLEKIESGKMRFEYASIDPIGLARRAIEDNEGYASKLNIRLALDTDLTQGSILGDHNRLLQVLANLISNAAKYSPPAGTVSVAVHREQNAFIFSVHDDGPGIPESFRSRIFQRFAQANSSDTREKGGFGLGLSISKAIIERHGGTIGYQSQPGQGTTFSFRLPEYL